VQPEHTPFTFAGFVFCWSGECSIEKIHVQLGIAVELKGSLGGTRGNESEIPCLGIAHEIHAVKTAPDMRVAKYSDQPL
jgi:hypothetical protein